eukprot:sb/3470077/
MDVISKTIMMGKYFSTFLTFERPFSSMDPLMDCQATSSDVDNFLPHSSHSKVPEVPIADFLFSETGMCRFVNNPAEMIRVTHNPLLKNDTGKKLQKRFKNRQNILFLNNLPSCRTVCNEIGKVDVLSDTGETGSIFTRPVSDLQSTSPSSCLMRPGSVPTSGNTSSGSVFIWGGSTIISSVFRKGRGVNGAISYSTMLLNRETALLRHRQTDR